MEPSCVKIYKLELKIELDWMGAVIGTEEYLEKRVLEELNLPTKRIVFPEEMAGFTIKNIRKVE